MRPKLLTKIAAFVLLANTAFAAGDGWMTDYNAAKKKAIAEKKDLLVEFTGSDWCPPCKMLNKNVFSKPEFVKNASEKFVLVALDYPRRKELPAAEKAQNTQLMALYSVNSFPTVLLCDATGMPYARQGFEQGGPKEYLAALVAKLPAKAQFKEAVAEADKLEGKEKADALWAAINSLEDVPVALSLDSVLKSILEADSTDAGGKIEGIYINAELANLKEGEDYKPVFKKYDDYLTKLKVEGDKKQRLLTKKLDALYKANNFAGMRTVIAEIIALDPESKVGKNLTKSIPRIDKMEKDYNEKKAAVK